ncbi:hypothetical protein FACS1894189_4440 [Planctomycetales bacterium]|nr:hypothetical protein FACS1894189_4440 [Planctomycetales bacterium]
MQPAPFWFVEFFKVVGFVLHTIPMGIWFAGLPVAVLCALWNCKHSRQYAQRMFGQFPIMMALGINFGIVPLLFLQTTYYESFYTATILMAWHWIVIIPILIVGYYSLYLAAFSRRSLNGNQRNGKMILYGIIASLCLTGIGILIANGLSLMVRSDLWAGIMERTNYYGATTGAANNMRDPALWVRLATMFGLGLLTTSVWAVVDSHLLLRPNHEPSNHEPEAIVPGNDITAYQRWTTTLAVILSFLGAVILTGTECQVKAESASAALKTLYPHFGFILLLAYLVFVSFILTKRSKKFLCVAGTLHLLTLAGFGIIRQIGQNAGVAPFVNVSQLDTSVQWSPLIAFLVVFLLGVGLILWMVRQAAKCH